MNDSSSVTFSSAATSPSSKLTHINNKNKDIVDDVITNNEKVNLTKHQHQVLKIICDTYQISFGMHAASISRNNEI
jgi:hypothetical protein